MPEKKLVVYHSRNEVLVCKAEDEHYLLLQYFKEGKRDKAEYDRDETNNDTYVIVVEPRSLLVNIQ